MGRKVENLLVYSALVTLRGFIIIITFFIRTGLRFWDCLWLSHHPYNSIWTLFVLTNAYLFLSTQNTWESCVKWIMRTWDTWSTKQWICVQEEWGRCTGTSFLSVCKHSFFSHRILSSEMVTKPFILGLLLLLQHVQLVFHSGRPVHEAASEIFLSDASSVRQQGAVAEQAFPPAWCVWLLEIAPDLVFSSEAQESSEFVNQHSRRNLKWSAALKRSGKSTALANHRLPPSRWRAVKVVGRIYLLTYTTLGRQTGCYSNAMRHSLSWHLC